MSSDLTASICSFIKDKVARAEEREFFRPPLIGYSPASDPLYEEIVRVVGPKHLRPEDFLPSVRTVISFFIPFQKGLVEGNRWAGPVSEAWGHSYVTGNRLINKISQELCEFLNNLGNESALVPASFINDPETLKASWSHRSAALIGGLGRFGLNRMLITKAGCAGRYGTVFTSAELPQSPRPDEEYCLYYKNDSCKVCLKACPAEALSTDGFERHQCSAQLESNKKHMLIDGERLGVCGKCVVAGPCAYIENY